MILTENRGNHENVPVVEFGTGDIALCNCYPKDQELYGNKYPELWMSQHEAKPLEEWDNPNYVAGESSDNLRKENVILRFTRPESIDQVIKSLLELKDSFSQMADIDS